jgi:outer membrane protein OmpA-like peptidoglycan-associated protein
MRPSLLVPAAAALLLLAALAAYGVPGGNGSKSKGTVEIAAAAVDTAISKQDTTATSYDGPLAAFLLPDVGIFFVRYGEPGAVEILSRTGPPELDSAVATTGQIEFPDSETIARIVAEELGKHRAEQAVHRKERESMAAREKAKPRTLEPPSAGVTILGVDRRRPPLPADTSEVALASGEEAPDARTQEPLAEEITRETSPEEVREFIAREFRYGGLLRTNLVIFETDKSTLLHHSHLVLDAIGDVMREFPKMRLRIEGHADQRGTDEYNLELSRRRAEAVREYLMDTAGIPPGRIETAGYGESRPLVPGTNMTALTLSRRVEFRVLNPDEVFPDG